MPLGTPEQRGGADLTLLANLAKNNYIIEITLPPDRVPPGSGYQNARALTRLDIRTDQNGVPFGYIGGVGVIPQFQRSSTVTNPVNVNELPADLTQTPPALVQVTDRLTQAFNQGLQVTSANGMPVTADMLPNAQQPRGNFPQGMDTSSFNVGRSYRFSQGRELIFNALGLSEFVLKSPGQQMSPATLQRNVRAEAITPAILDFYLRTGAQISATVRDGLGKVSIVPVTRDMFPNPRAQARIDLPDGTTSFRIRWPTGYSIEIPADQVPANLLDWYLTTGASIQTNNGIEITPAMFQARANPDGRFPAGVVEFNLRWGVDAQPLNLDGAPYWRTGFEANAPRPR
jgi:hypothetical protein